MKKFLLCVVVLVLFVSCSKDEQAEPVNDKQTEEVKDPIIEGSVLVKLDWGPLHQGIGLFEEDDVPIKLVEAEIVGGDSNYKVIYPKKVICRFWDIPFDSPLLYQNYSEEIVRVQVEGNIVKVERGILTCNTDGIWFSANFMLENGSGERIILTVESIATNSELDPLEEEKYVKSLIANHDYWQWPEE